MLKAARYATIGCCFFPACGRVGATAAVASYYLLVTLDFLLPPFTCFVEGGDLHCHHWKIRCARYYRCMYLSYRETIRFNFSCHAHERRRLWIINKCTPDSRKIWSYKLLKRHHKASMHAWMIPSSHAKSKRNLYAAIVSTRSRL